MNIILSLIIGVLLTINITNAQFFWSSADLKGKLNQPTTYENFNRNVPDSILPVYTNIRRASWGDYMFLQEVSSDAIVVPARGGDWDDGGIWRALQEHTWTPFLGFVNGAWREAYMGIAMANVTIDSLDTLTSDSLLIAEARFLRALYYWWLLDLFRNVPLVTDPTPDPDNPPAQNTPLEVFNFIVEEINAALPDLEESFGEDNYGRATKGAANALLATVYLNAEVYTGTAMWNDCIAACDAVINSGVYDLMNTYSDVFALENEGSGNVENIFVVVHEPEDGVTSYRHMATLHYNQLPASPWNGFSVLADFYTSFDTSDVRIDHLLVGPQLILGGPNEGQQAYNRLGDSLIFTVESPLIDATEGNGPRILKWPIDPNMSGWFAGNDYAIFRYSHILLAKAEAQLMLGNTTEALELVNLVRERAFEPDKPLTSITLGDILNERGYEFLWEGFRRQDLIRTGHWSDTWSLHETSSADYTKLFPIPHIQLDINPYLVQNPGYDVAPEEIILVVPLSIEFGDVSVGETNTDQVTVTNAGTHDLHVTSISISGDNAANFGVNTWLFTLAPNASLFLDVNFTPDDIGSFSASLNIYSGGGNVSIDLAGVGIDQIPFIISITDVPYDQGGWVYLSWDATMLDTIGDIAQYGVWELNPENEWIALGNVPVIQEDHYTYLAHTFGDSTADGIFWSEFRVTAHTIDPDVFYTSLVDSGYSVDNLAPAVPTGLLASIGEGNTVELSWDPPVDEDFNYFKIYRSLEPDFDPIGMDPLVLTIDTTFTDGDVVTGETYYYRMSALDFNGNESELSAAVSVEILSIDETVGVPEVFALLQNYPNPFNPVTNIAYELPQSAIVNLSIYNITGQLVETLVNEHINAGYHSVVWNVGDVGSGLYFYRIEVGEYTETKKCVILK